MRHHGRTTIASLAVALLAVGWSAGSRAETPPASDPTAAAVGPSFICAPGQEPLAQLICGDHDLSRTDLRFVQAYQALRQQSDPAGRAALWREQIAFHSAVLAQCSIPATGDLPSIPPGMTACVQQAYNEERQQWLSRLSGPALEEANRPIEEHIAAQRELQAKGFLPSTAAIDGVYGPATRAAIVAFQTSAGQEPTGLLSDQETDALALPEAPVDGSIGHSNSQSLGNATSSEPNVAGNTELGPSTVHVRNTLALLKRAQQKLADSRRDASKSFEAMAWLRALVRNGLGCGQSSDNDCIRDTAEAASENNTALRLWNTLMTVERMREVASGFLTKDHVDKISGNVADFRKAIKVRPSGEGTLIGIARSTSLSVAVTAIVTGKLLRGLASDTDNDMGRFQISGHGMLYSFTDPGHGAARSMRDAADLLDEAQHEFDIATETLGVPSGEVLANQPLNP